MKYLNTIKLFEKFKRGYTLVELIITIVIASIIITSVAMGYRQIVEAIVRSGEFSKAINLSEREFSIINSLPYNDSTLANGYDNTTTNYANSGYDLRRRVNYVKGNDSMPQSLKRIIVDVYKPSNPNPILEVATYRANNVTYGP